MKLDGQNHTDGDEECTEGWCGGEHYPAKCECGGRIHAEFKDENYDGDYQLITKCDKCGCEEPE